jgi:Ca-activated chloride channel family protein
MIFANPRMLWLLLAIPPALGAFFWWSARLRQRLLTQFIQARLLPSLTIGISPTRQKIRLGCLVVAVVCLILALARPQWGFDWEEVKQRGLDIVVAIDTSKSMLAEDIAPNRLARAKLAALDLMQRAKADRLGLVAFAGSAFLQCPLTFDDAAFRQSVESLDVNTIPQGGTAIAEAIETALSAYKEGDNYKVLVLFTDGEDHDSGAEAAAEKAAKEGLRIYTIGIGTAEGELLRVKDAKGNSDYVRDEQGNVVKSHLNERLLQQIASATEGGFYLPLRGAKAIDTLYDQGLATLPKSQHQQKLVRRYHERYHWPLAIAIVLLLIEMLFPERKRERPPRRAQQAKAKPSGSPPSIPAPAPAPALQPARSLTPLLSLLSLATYLLLSASPVAASPGSALREYKAGKYEDSLKEYERLLQKNKDDPRLHFNAGAAAYKNQQFEEAAKQFNATLSAPDLKLQGLGYYNEGNALFHLGERNSDPKQRQESWQKALQDYQSTMKLNPQDADAKHNYDFVKKMLEELKQQQQQQSKQDQNQDQNQQQQDQQNQQQQDQQKQDQQKQQDQKQNQQQQQQQSEQQKQQAEQDQQKKQEQQQAQQAEQKKQEQQQAQQAAGEKSDEKEKEAAAAQGMAQMTPEQAKQLLDSEKDDEKMLQPKSTGKPSDQNRPFKDW